MFPTIRLLAPGALRLLGIVRRAPLAAFMSTPVATPSSRIVGLDILRTCAIMGVVVAHGLSFLYPHLTPVRLNQHIELNLGYLGHGGFYGVELFFALSGFLIGRILWRAGESLGQPREMLRFWSRRWFRTLPAYFLFLLINMAVFSWVLPQPMEWAKLARYPFFLQIFTENNAFFFSETWSLAIEEWFYFLFPIGLFLLLRARLSWPTAFLAAGAAFYLFSTFFRWHIAGIGGVVWSADPRTITLARFDAIMVGIFAAWASVRFPNAFRKVRIPLAWIGCGVLLYAYVTLFRPPEQQDRLFAGTLRFNLVSAGFACLLPWGYHFKASRWNWIDTVFNRLACWSYAMYLCNMLFWHLLIRKFLPDTQTSALQGIGGWFLFMGLTIGFSALTYHVFELPCTRLRDRFRFSQAAEKAV